MIYSVWLVLVLHLDSYISVNAARTCTDGMMMCTQQMTSAIAASSNATVLCGIMDNLMSCIHQACNASLTSCDINKARNAIADLAQDYSFQCEMIIPPVQDRCNWSYAAASTFSTSITCVVLYTIYMLIYLNRLV